MFCTLVHYSDTVLRNITINCCNIQANQAMSMYILFYYKHIPRKQSIWSLAQDITTVLSFQYPVQFSPSEYHHYPLIFIFPLPPVLLLATVYCSRVIKLCSILTMPVYTPYVTWPHISWHCTSVSLNIGLGSSTLDSLHNKEKENLKI